jgi:hypothetical protein
MIVEFKCVNGLNHPLTGLTGSSTTASLPTSELRPRGVASSIVRQYATTINAKCYETSSYHGIGISQPFIDLTRDFTLRPRRPVTSYSPVISLHDSPSSSSAAAGNQRSEHKEQKSGGICCS